MATSESINYPDFVGFITENQRANLGDLHGALSVHPPEVSPGGKFEILCLLQNSLDIPLDLSLSLTLSDPDHFQAERSQLEVQLAPAEAGLAVFEAACSPGAAPGKDYSIAVSVKAQRTSQGKKASRIRLKEGGGKVIPAVLPEATRQQLVSLRAFTWEGRLSRQRLEAKIQVRSQAAPAAGITRRDTGWNSLWMLDVRLDEHLLAQHVAGYVNAILPHYTVEKMFKPLFAATQKQFAGIYPLKTAETLYLAKLLTHVLCNTPVQKPASGHAPPDWPAWYRELLRMLYLEPLFSARPEQTVTQWLYPYLLEDAILQGFTLIKGSIEADFGDQAEQASYAEGVVTAFKERRRLNFEQIYLPLMCASTVVAGQIVMPHEIPSDTLSALARVCEGRTAERSDANAFVFDLFKRLIDRVSGQV